MGAMRQKELRIALVCYGGVSLAIYMHGVTKEVWKLARASRALHDDVPALEGVEGVYLDLLRHIMQHMDIRLRVLPDILAGASAGGINAVFLAQAIHSGQSLEPLTELWLKNADVDALTDPDALPRWRYSKIWAQPVTSLLLRHKNSAVTQSVSPETRSEVRRKVSHFVRGRWFEPPFSGIGFSRLLHDALQSMGKGVPGPPLLPPGHPIDLLVTTTDFHGFPETLRLNSPMLVEESEHRLPISFRSRTPPVSGQDLADPLELTFAARATASFPGAFPPLQVREIDALARGADAAWSGRDAFLSRIMPVHVQRNTAEDVSLVDGSVLVNAPFAGAISVLPARPAQREVDRRFVYIDPSPDRFRDLDAGALREVGFFRAIFGSISTIPREQPIRDNLEVLESRSREAARMRRLVERLRPEVEGRVDALFGRTPMLDRPNPRRLAAWRKKAHRAAERAAGYAFHAYEHAKISGIVDRIAATIHAAAPQLDRRALDPVVHAIRVELERQGVFEIDKPGSGSPEPVVNFLRAHDLSFRVRRLRLIARRLSRDWEADPAIDDAALDTARDSIYAILALYFASDGADALGDDFPAIARNVLEDPAWVLEMLDQRRKLPEIDARAEAMLADALLAMPQGLRRKVLLVYLGFPFYDAATLPLLRNEGLTEFEGVKVDRISPEDAPSIRSGGARETLRGTEFFNFGAFFSRAYRENDYLWGRLHGAERMIDLVCSTVPGQVADDACQGFKRAAFRAIVAEERARLLCDPELLDQIEREIG